MSLPALGSLWHSVPWAVIDLETDGPKPTEAMPCEIAVARFEGGELVGTWSSLLNPGRPMSAEVIGVHGITDAMVKGAPPETDAIDLLIGSRLLEGAYPCGYNSLHYDRTILRRIADGDCEGDADLLPWLKADWLDPLVYIRDIDGLVKGERGRHKLTAACTRRGIVHERAHRAFGDCEATGKLLWALRERIGDMSLEQLVRRTKARGDAQTEDLNRYWGRGKVHGGRDVA